MKTSKARVKEIIREELSVWEQSETSALEPWEQAKDDIIAAIREKANQLDDESNYAFVTALKEWFDKNVLT